MADNLRFAALAVALFVLSYSGVAWAIAGAPIPALSHVVLKPAPEIRAAIPIPQPPRAAASANLNPNSAIPYRDRLRLAAYQASTAYAQAPCDAAAKANLVEAVSAYAQAWHDLMDCGASGCDSKKLNAASAAFSTPLDLQVREAIAAAFDKRGVSVDDFPAALRINITMLARGTGDPVAACAKARSAVR